MAWCRTETNWAGEGELYQIGPFDLHSGYQRADLTVAGPPIYCGLDCAEYRELSTIYAASGMSSISNLLVALGRVLPGARLIAPPGAYGETLEAAAQYGAGLRLDESLLADPPIPQRRSARATRSPHRLVRPDVPHATAPGRRVRSRRLRHDLPFGRLRAYSKSVALGRIYRGPDRAGAQSHQA